MPKKTDQGGPEQSQPDRHKNPVLSLRPPKRLRAVLEGLAEAERRSQAQMALLLLEEALKARGLWPPPAPPG